MEACRAIRHRWSLRALVAAYLDLAVAYLFLCAASLSFFFSKLLSFVGLSLPCTCDFLAIDRRPQPQMRDRQQQQLRNVGCLQGFLVDYPSSKIGGVFDSVCGNLSYGPRNRVEQLDGRDGSATSSPLLGMGQGDESRSASVPPTPLPFIPPPTQEFKKSSVPGPVLVDGVEFCSFKGKNFGDPKGKVSFRQEHVQKRRRLHKNTLSLRCNSFPASPSPLIEIGGKGRVVGNSPLFVSSRLPEADISPDATPRAVHHLSVVQNDLVEEITKADECQTMEKALSNDTESVSQEEKNESDVIKELKQALEEERSARAALNLELEKEWNAASSATDEAMAMIARLQEEKSALQLESRQHLRMMEEKSIYDSEEMSILKEIIVRREREKHVLEMEVEAYKKIVFGGNAGIEHPPDELQDVAALIEQGVDSLFGSLDDPEPMLKEVYESIKRKENLAQEMQHVVQTEPFMAAGRNYSNADLDRFSRIKKHLSGVVDDVNIRNVKERTMEIYPASVQNRKSSCGSEPSSPALAHLIDREDSKQDRKIEVQSDVAKANSCQFGAEARVLDVHVIDDKSEPNMLRSSSDVAALSMDVSSSKLPRLDLRRMSMPEIDKERFTLENEVELLRKRLKEVQEGREKLSISGEQKEDNLNRLEEISHQLHEIKKATKSGKNAYHASLPPLSKGKHLRV